MPDAELPRQEILRSLDDNVLGSLLEAHNLKIDGQPRRERFLETLNAADVPIYE